MNKNELIAALAEKTGMGKSESTAAVEGLFEIVTAALKDGDEVRIVGFGTFLVSARKAGKGRNPQTGEEIDIPASKAPKFRAGKQLKDAVN
jgi:DNA-binding protein HU-beta